jgi:hypothetical protein
VKDHLKEYVLEYRLKQQSNIVTSPPRRIFPKRWKYNDTTLKLRTNAMIIYLRRTDEYGYIALLENDFLVSQQYLNQLVRAEVDLAKRCIRFYALKRLDWKIHRLLKTITFNVKKIIKNKKII